MAKTILASALTAILTTLVIIGGVKLTDTNVYYCEERSIVMRCSSLSAYYGLPNGKCNSNDGNRLCRSGWDKVINDLNLTKEVIVPPIEAGGDLFSNGKIWSCESNKPYSKCKSGTHQAYYGELR